MPTVLHGMEASNPSEAADRRLMTEFPELLGAVSLTDVVEYSPPPVRRNPPPQQPLEAYQLVPMLPDNPPFRLSSSVDMTGAFYSLPEGIKQDYWWNREDGVAMHLGHGNLDSHSGAGLAFHGMLVAVSSGYVWPYQGNYQRPELVIKQLQGWVQKKYHPEHMPGLKGGFQWRDALIHVWERIAASLDVTVVTIPDQERHPNKIDHSAAAQRCGFTHDPYYGYWTKHLTPAA